MAVFSREDHDKALAMFRGAIGVLNKRSQHAEDCGIIPCSCGLAEARSSAVAMASVISFDVWTDPQIEAAKAEGARASRERNRLEHLLRHHPGNEEYAYADDEELASLGVDLKSPCPCNAPACELARTLRATPANPESPR